MRSVATVAESLGMEQRNRRWGPCPACGAERGKQDPRPPVAVYRDDMWKCYACGVTGDALALVSLRMGFGVRPAGASYHRVMDRLRELGLESPVVEAPRAIRPPPEDAYLPTGALQAVWSACLPVSASTRGCYAYIMSRRTTTSFQEVRYMPQSVRPRWWRVDYPLLVPAYDAYGTMRSLHGHAVDVFHHPKTCWPTGYSARGLMFMSQEILAWKAGAPQPKVVLFAEGMTDFLTAVDHIATIGITSGSAPAVRLLGLERDTEAYTAMDPDNAGAAYESALADALWPIVARPLPLRRLTKAS